MNKEDIKHLSEFYENLKNEINSFSQDIMKLNLITILNDERKISNEFNCDKKDLDEILQKLETLRQDTNKILSKLCIEKIKSRVGDNNG